MINTTTVKTKEIVIEPVHQLVVLISQKQEANDKITLPPEQQEDTDNDDQFQVGKDPVVDPLGKVVVHLFSARLSYQD